MNITTNAQGKERKNLVKAIAEITGQNARYNGAPGFTYIIGNITVERDGSITADDTEMNALATELQSRGFEIEMPQTAEPAQEEQDGQDDYLPARHVQQSLALGTHFVRAAGLLLRRSLSSS